MNKKGFTLIELLVVIAIIGILASIVLVSLGGARARARDARIIADMGQVRTTGEIYHEGQTPPSYTGFCASTDVTTLSADIADQGGVNYACGDSADAYCAEVELNSGAWWCVDSNLVSEQFDSASPPICDPAAATPVLKCK